ncbi:MAG: major capsid protein [Lysobacteraceae bacterium]
MWSKSCGFCTAHATCQLPSTKISEGFYAVVFWRVFPTGTIDTFATYFAPADFNETVNTLGQPLYAKQEPRKFDRGTDLHTQSNPLPMCHRPGVLIKLTSA